MMEWIHISGFFYSGMVGLLLLFTLVGFVWSHVVYSEKVEEVKFRILEVEDLEK